MRPSVQYREYYAEVREQVCGTCPEHPADNHSFGPRCRGCGLLLQLPKIVQSIQDAGAELDEFDPHPALQVVCARCSCLENENCPCPGGALHNRVVRAVKAVDDRRGQREQMRLWLAAQPRREVVHVSEMIRAYEERTGTCVGCD